MKEIRRMNKRMRMDIFKSSRTDMKSWYIAIYLAQLNNVDIEIGYGCS